MKRSWWYRFSFLLVMIVISVLAIVPTVMDFDKNSKFFIRSKINLGLDLKGGIYMILGIDFKKVYKDEIQLFANKFIDLLEKESIQAQLGEMDLSDPLDPKQIILLNNESQRENVVKIFHDEGETTLNRIVVDEGNKIGLALSTKRKNDLEQESVGKSIEVIRNRIDEFGVTEPEIVSQGNDRIVVQLPGVDDIDRAKELIGKTAKLEFRIVKDHDMNELYSFIDKASKAGINYDKEGKFSDYVATLNEFLKNDIPEGYELVFEKKFKRGSTEVEALVPYLVENTTKLTGDALADARLAPSPDGTNRPVVALLFKSSGAKIFGEITGKNIRKRLAIVLDGNVYSAPSIKDRIASKHATITLDTSKPSNLVVEEGRNLAMVLRAGALPVQLDFLEQRKVGATLGHDSIEKAKKASMIGCALVFIFILVYYKLSGFFALITLSLNILFVLACLVGLEATLTLPGIAGIALTIGMAVDANIVIYERIREEMKLGVGNYKAVEAGFSRAFWTILDANITTALAGFCLLNFGTGPVRGFAVTLLIGIFATIYTSYFVSRILFEFYMNKVEGQELSI